MNINQIEKGVELIIKGLGINPKDPNFEETPERYARFLSEMFNKKSVNYAVFPEHVTDFIVFRDHELWSLCPHHLLPVRLKVSVAYIPGDNVLGLSKLPRLLEEVNDRPLLQEAFTSKVIERLIQILPDCKGAGCIVRGKHSCTSIRGIKSKGSMLTYLMHGRMKTDELSQRFFDLVLHK